MADIDEVKEDIGYMKVWLGIIVVTNISLMGWLLSNYETSSMIKIISDIIAIIVLLISIVKIDRNIKIKIKSLKDL
jgi:hypothetical protein